MQISEIEVRRHHGLDGSDDTIAVKAVVEPGDAPLDVIDALDDIIRRRLFTPHPKAWPATRDVPTPAAEPVHKTVNKDAPNAAWVGHYADAPTPVAEPVRKQEPAPVVEAAPEPVVDPVKQEAPAALEIDAASFSRRVAELAKSVGAAAVIAALKGRRVADIPADERGPILSALEGAAA